MNKKLNIGDQFPDFELPDQDGILRNLSEFTQQSEADKRYGFQDGYPIIVVFTRGFFCGKDQEQLRSLVTFQSELNVNLCRIVSISADEIKVSAAFRAGLGAKWTFFSDLDRSLIKNLDILDETEGEYAYRAIPHTFVLKSNLEIHKIYNGWFFVGRPTVEELRQDLRQIMETSDYYSYEVFNSEHIKKIRIPQQTWHENGLIDPEKQLEGTVESFDLKTGNGFIRTNGIEELIFFNFTAIPGEGYRTIKPGTSVYFELIETHTGLSAFNIRIKEK